MSTTADPRETLTLDELSAEQVRDLRWLAYEVMADAMMLAIDPGDGGSFADAETVLIVARAAGALGTQYGEYDDSQVCVPFRAAFEHLMPLHAASASLEELYTETGARGAAEEDTERDSWAKHHWEMLVRIRRARRVLEALAAGDSR